VAEEEQGGEGFDSRLGVEPPVVAIASTPATGNLARPSPIGFAGGYRQPMTNSGGGAIGADLSENYNATVQSPRGKSPSPVKACQPETHRPVCDNRKDRKAADSA
jgi:hypothetical protein